MKKRMLSILLCLVMVVGLLPTAALAAEPEGSTEGALVEKTVTVIKELNFLAEPQYIKITHGQRVGDWLTALKTYGNLRAADGSGWEVDSIVNVRDNTTKKIMADTDTFDKTHLYYVNVSVNVTDGANYRLQSAGLDYPIAVNGDDHNSNLIEAFGNRVGVSLKFDNIIDEVKLNVTEPAANGTPQVPTAAAADAGYTVNSVMWFEKSEYDAGRRNEVTTFEADKSYVAHIMVTPKTGYCFISGTPVTATVNDKHTAAGVMSNISAFFTVVFPATGGNVKFHPNGGSGNMPDVTTLSTLPDCDFTAPTGKTFDGWSLKPNGTKLESAPDINGKGITLFARWKDTTSTTTLYEIQNFYFTVNAAKFKITANQDINAWLTELKNSGNLKAANSADGWEVESIGLVYDKTTKKNVTSGTFDATHGYTLSVYVKDTNSSDDVNLPMTGTAISAYVNRENNYDSPMTAAKSLVLSLSFQEPIGEAIVTVEHPSVNKAPNELTVTAAGTSLNQFNPKILAWYEADAFNAGRRNEVTAFEGGKSYVPYIKLTAKEDYRFYKSTVVKVNGESTEISGIGDTAYGPGPAILCPTQQLTGTVTYTGAARYGATLTANVTGEPTGAALSYQWQYKNDATWTDISGATAATYGPTDTTGEMVGKEIRVKVSATGYTGSIYGAAKTVTKDTCYAIPVAPVLNYASGTIRVTNPQENQEYYWTTTEPTGTTRTWPKNEGADVTPNLTNNSFNGELGTTYYVYTRVKETNAKRAGEIVRTGSISIPAASGSEDPYTPATGLIYPDYPTTPRTIYVPINGTVTVNYQITPAGANANLPQWAESTIDGTSRLSDVSADNGILTIKANSTTGNTKVMAYKGSTHDVSNLFGTGSDAGYEIQVAVYDPSNLASTITDYTTTNLETVKLYVGDTYTLDLDDLKDTLNFLPAGIDKTGYALEAYIYKAATGGSIPQFKTEDTYVNIESNTGKIKANTYAAGNDTTVYLLVKAPGESEVNKTRNPAAIFSVKVEQNNIPLTGITVAPATLTLHKDDTFTLSATKTPLDATETITWESNNTSVATVDSSTGKVTAVAESGTATITAKNSTGTITATCTVTVKPAACATHSNLTYTDLGTLHKWTCGVCEVSGLEDHSYGAWSEKNDTDHKHTCANCSHEETEPHSWVVDSAVSTTAGSVAYKCNTTGCNATKNVALTAITSAPLTVTAPVRDAAPTDATTTETTFTVANTTWYPTVSGAFAAGTVYSVQIDLEAVSGNYFNDSTSFTINSVAPTSQYIAPTGETASLTYTFDATEGTAPTPPTTYAVTVNGSEAATTGAGNYAAGATVTINAGTKSGFTFSGWTTSDGVSFANANSANTTFTMPAKPVTVTANWTKNSSGGGGGGISTYAITVEDAKHGDVKADRKSASSGTTVTITVDPDKGYTLETLTVLDKNGKEVKLTDKGNGKYTFKMPASKVTVKAAFAEDNSMLNFFVDVPVDAYYYDAVLWAAENGITGGVDAVHFAPNAACTRAQIVTFLWRAAGSPEPKAVSSFTDVSADAYYAKAVAWAVENGITGGIGGNKFAPDATCTRAQAVTFLYRAAGSPAVSSDAAFSDVGTDAYYANAVAWAAKEGITGGIGGGLFGSDNDCTRAQIVTFLYRSVK